MVIRDMLKLVDNAHEAKRSFMRARFWWMAKPRRDVAPIGMFDLIGLPLLDQQYRMLKDEKRMFYLSLLEAGRAAGPDRRQDHPHRQ